MNNAQERHPVIDILLQKPIKTVVVEKMGTVQPILPCVQFHLLWWWTQPNRLSATETDYLPLTGS